MRFQSKVFLAVFLNAAGFLIIMTFALQSQLKGNLERQFLDQYDSLAQVVGDTLRNMENASALTSEAAARYLFEVEKHSGVPSEQQLKDMKGLLKVSMFSVADQDGTLLRDTETPPEKRTFKIYDFCAQYRDILKDSNHVETTPILPSYPTGHAYKFTMVPNHNRTKILESGIRLDFIQEILQKALVSDKNLISLGVFTPNGTILGYSAADQKPYKAGDAAPVDLTLGKPIVRDNSIAYVKKVAASSEVCCECAQKKLTGPDGKYFYLLRSEISLAPLTENIRALREKLAIVLLVSLLGAFFFARWLAQKLAQRLQMVQGGVNQIMGSGDLTLRIQPTGSDEFADLGRKFDQMISTLEVMQKKNLEAERAKALASLASQVAHDIRSPLAALDVVLNDVSKLPEDKRILVKSAVGRIRDIANNLLKKEAPQPHSDEVNQVYLLPGLTESVISEMKTRYRDRHEISWDFEMTPDTYGLFAVVAAQEYRRVVANLINNAVEAIPQAGSIRIRMSRQGQNAILTVEDTGVGIAAEVMPRLKQKGATFGKPSGSGLGLYHADQAIQRWGGSLQIGSDPGRGAKVEVRIPIAQAPAWYVPQINIPQGAQVVVLDDDESIHQIWANRIKGVAFRNFKTSREFEAWFSQNAQTQALFLFDLELIGDAKNGLQLIQEHGLVDRAILVTSSFDDAQVTQACLNLGLRLIPKAMAGFVPIQIQ